jgi:hypothetical protein
MADKNKCSMGDMNKCSVCSNLKHYDEKQGNVDYKLASNELGSLSSSATYDLEEWEKQFSEECKKPLNLHTPRSVDSLEALCLVKVGELLPPLTHPDAAYGLTLPMLHQKTLANTRLVNLKTIDLHNFKSRIGAIFNDLGLAYIIAGGYPAHRAGVTSEYSDLDFFSVVPRTLENNVKIEALPKRLRNAGLEATSAYYFKRGAVIKVKQSNSTEKADLVFMYRIAPTDETTPPPWMCNVHTATQCEADLFQMARAVTHQFDLEVCKVAALPCGENLLILCIMAFEFDNEQYSDEDLELAKHLNKILVDDCCHITHRLRRNIHCRSCTRSVIKAIFDSNSSTLKSLLKPTNTSNIESVEQMELIRTLPRYIKYGARIKRDRSCLTSKRIRCMIEPVEESLLQIYSKF